MKALSELNLHGDFFYFEEHGWLIILKLDNPADMDPLMNAGKYPDMLKELP